MKKLGILTFWGVPNAGAFGQAYALQKTLSSLLLEWQVYQIKHLCDAHRRFYLMDSPNVEKWQKELNAVYAGEFDKIPHIGLNEVRLDVVVLGSDIIWDFAIKEFGEDKYLFGNNLDADKVIAYAPSFGTCKSEWRRIPEYVTSGLTSLDAVSVRDENSAALAEYIIGQKPVIVLDPVWLWDWEKDETVKTPEMGNYILVYGDSFSEAYIAHLIIYAKNKKLQLVSYPNNNRIFPWCDINLNPSEVTPMELFGYFKGARLIATNSFHGLVFGLVFEKKIAYARSAFIDAKVKKLLVELGIDEYFDVDGDVEGMYSQKWDYAYINKVIESKRNRSIEYLLNSIAGGQPFAKGDLNES